MRGHAALGLADGIAPLIEEVGRPVGERVVVARIAPSAQVPTAWEVYSGDTYRAPWIFVVDGTPLDVAEVSTITYPRGTLARAATLADCVAAAGTYWYSLDELFPASLNLARWGESFAWDVSDWGGYPYLYVNLGGDDPADELVTVSPEILTATRALVIPTLAETDELAGIGAFDAWTGDLPDGWTISISGDGSYAQVDGAEGGSAIEFRCGRDKDEVKGSATSAAIAPVVGAYYHAQGLYYATDPAFRPTLTVQSTESATDYQFTRDGRHVVALDTGLPLAGVGAWRYFSFLFRARDDGGGTSTNVLILGADKRGDLRGDTAAVRFDQVTVRRVRRFARAMGRIVGEVSTETGIESATSFGGKSVGAVRLSLSNTDGVFDVASRDLVWGGASLTLDLLARRASSATLRDRHGRFLPSVPAAWRAAAGASLSDARRVAAGVVQDPERSDDALTIQADEFRALLYERRAAARTYQSDLDPLMDARIAGRARPLAIGEIVQLEPSRIGQTADGVGVYEVADPQWSAGIYSLDSVRLYADSDAASRRDAGLSLELLNVAGAITPDLAACGFSGATPLKPLRLDVEHEWFQFEADGNEYYARMLYGNDTIEAFDADADGTDVDSVVTGAATQWEAVVAQDGSYARTASNTAANSYISVSAEPLPTVTSIEHVELRAVIYVPAGTIVGENSNAFATLYAKISGVRYEGPEISIWDLVSGAKAVSHLWAEDPSTSAPWTEAGFNATEWGVRWRTGNTYSYLRVEMIRPEARLFRATPTSDSNPGICIPVTLAQRLQAAMRIAYGGDRFDVTLDADYKLQIDATGGISTFSIRSETGKQKNGWSWLGFSSSADLTGSLTYTADTPIYVPESDVDTPVMRCAIVGYKDDASGTYTGMPGQPIQLDCDVARFKMVEFFNLPFAWTDPVSFAAARSRDGVRTLAEYVTSEQTVADSLSAIERAALADIVFAPALDPALPVLVKFVPFTRVSDGTEPLVQDADWLTLADGGKRSDMAATVEVAWGRSLPLGGTRSATDPLAPVLRRTDTTRTVETDLATSAQAQDVADLTLPLVSGPRRISGTARGLLLRSAADRCRVTRARAALDDALFRLESVSHSLRSGTSTVTAVQIDEDTR